VAKTSANLVSSESRELGGGEVVMHRVGGLCASSKLVTEYIHLNVSEHTQFWSFFIHSSVHPLPGQKVCILAASGVQGEVTRSESVISTQFSTPGKLRVFSEGNKNAIIPSTQTI